MTLVGCNKIVLENTQLSAASENATSSMIDVLLHVICYRLSTSSESHSLRGYASSCQYITALVFIVDARCMFSVGR